MTFAQPLPGPLGATPLPARRQPRGDRRAGATVGVMSAAPESRDPGLEVAEARLARAAAAGDGEAFATLYERYARRAYNLALRLSGSEEDAADAVQEAFLGVMRRLAAADPERELAFGSYLFTATRNATYDLMRASRRTRPSDSIAESAVPLGAGAGGLGLDPGDPDEDPDRRALLAAQREQIAAANARLPERQREALALRELEEMSYDEIAAAMGMNRNSVAQLISRARINLRDELRGTALASVAVSSPECERALPLIAADDDGQLDPGAPEADWLASHLAGCGTCAVAREAMREAGVSYRAWIPVAVAPWVFRETMARAAELVGAGAEEWGAVAERWLSRPTEPAALPGLPAPYRTVVQDPAPRRRRRMALAVVLAALLLLAGAIAAGSVGGGGEEPAPPAAREVEDVFVEPGPAAREPAEAPAPAAAPERAAGDLPEPEPEPSNGAAPEPAPVSASAPAAGPPESKAAPPSAPEPAGGTGLEPPRQVREPQPEAEPEPAPELEPVPPPTEDPAEPVPPREPNPPPTPGGPSTPPRR